jgi:hypothetical protein
MATLLALVPAHDVANAIVMGMRIPANVDPMTDMRVCSLDQVATTVVGAFALKYQW